MTNEQFQLLAAAVLETASRLHPVKFVGDANRLIDVVQNDWDGPFSRSDVQQAIETLRKFGVIEQSSTSDFVSISHAIATGRLTRGNNLNFNPARVAPLLREYAEFGVDWLNRMWVNHMQGAAELATQEEDIPEPETTSVDSSAWTGLPQGFVLTEDKKVAIVRALDAAEEALTSSRASQHDQAQGRAYIVAARALLEAPDPEPELAWELISRANSIAGIASFFVSVIALFVAAA